MTSALVKRLGIRQLEVRAGSVVGFAVLNQRLVILNEEELHIRVDALVLRPERVALLHFFRLSQAHRPQCLVEAFLGLSMLLLGILLDEQVVTVEVKGHVEGRWLVVMCLFGLDEVVNSVREIAHRIVASTGRPCVIV